MLDHHYYGLFWKMRLGKTKAVIDAACLLHEAGLISAVVIACPAQVKDVWLDPTLGELQKHCFVPYQVWHYGRRELDREPGKLLFVVASYEYLRQENAQGDFYKVENLLTCLGHDKIFVVNDEGSELGTHDALQTKAMMRLRYSARVTRYVMLDGTPAGDSTLCLYSKLALIDKGILGYKNFFVFKRYHVEEQVITRSVYDEAKGKRRQKIVNKKITGFKDLDVITRKAAPHVEYLADVLNMPTKVESLISVPLTVKTWGVYRGLRDELIGELDRGSVQVNHAAVKVLRLAQVCAGFVGGVEDDDRLDLGDRVDQPSDQPSALSQPGIEPRKTVELSRETLTGLLRWLQARYQEDRGFRCVVWCRWRPEIERLAEALSRCSPRLGVWYGGRKDENFLHPDHPYAGPGIMVCQPQAAKYGVNFSKAGAAVYLSQGYGHVVREQSEERVQAPNGRETTLLLDVLVTGPDGQRTVTHDIISVLRTKEDLAKRTVAQWRTVLQEE